MNDQGEVPVRRIVREITREFVDLPAELQSKSPQEAKSTSKRLQSSKTTSVGQIQMTVRPSANAKGGTVVREIVTRRHGKICKGSRALGNRLPGWMRCPK